MKRFRNVLLVASLREGPVPRYLFARALTLARRNAAKLTLIEAVPKLRLIPEVLPQQVLELTLKDRRESLLRFAESAREQGLEVETALVTGTPFLEITRRVQQFRHDLVITDGWRGAVKSDAWMRRWQSATWVVCLKLVARCPSWTDCLSELDPA